MTKIDTGKLNETAYFTKLPNGLAIYVMKKPGFSKKTALLGVNYGSDDIFLDGKSHETPLGVAHFLEHKLFDLPDGRNTLQLLSQMGASPNAFTSNSATAYHFTCSDNFIPGFELLLEYVFTPYFTPESVEKEQGIIAQEISMRNDMPEARLFSELFALLYSNHPIKNPIIGTYESIKSITADTLHACYDAFYRPSNMVLTVVGDVDPNEIEAVTLARSPSSALTAPQFYCDEPHEVVELEKVINMDVPQPMFSLGIKLVPKTDRLPWEITCQLALAMLAGPQSRLYGELYDSGLIDSSFSLIPYLFKQGGVLFMSGRSKNPIAVRDAVVLEIEKFSAASIDTQLYERVKRATWGERMRVSDNFSALSRSISLDYLSGADYFSLPQAFDKADINSVYKIFSEMGNISIAICSNN